MDEEYKQSDISKVVEQLMDEEGYEFGEAVNGPGGYFGSDFHGFDDCLFGNDVMPKCLFDQ